MTLTAAFYPISSYPPSYAHTQPLFWKCTLSTANCCIPPSILPHIIIVPFEHLAVAVDTGRGCWCANADIIVCLFSLSLSLSLSVCLFVCLQTLLKMKNKARIFVSYGFAKGWWHTVHANSHNISKVANDAMFAKAKWWSPEEKQNKKFSKRVK